MRLKRLKNQGICVIINYSCNINDDLYKALSMELNNGYPMIIYDQIPILHGH